MKTHTDLAVRARAAGARLRLAGAVAGWLIISTLSLPAQQFRGLYVYAFSTSLDSLSGITNIVTVATNGHYNALVVQVLAYMDYNGNNSHGAHWRSNIVPRSPRNNSYDLLAKICALGHANGLQVHAWLGGSAAAMYRVSSAWPPGGTPTTLADHKEWFMVPYNYREGGSVIAFSNITAVATNTYIMLDMGGADAQEYIVSIVRELVSNYDIDGINWDDEHDTTMCNLGLGYPAVSTATYTRSGLARYKTNVGTTVTPPITDASYSNYRRRFKNELIARCQAEIQSLKPPPHPPIRHTASTVANWDAPGSCDFSSSEAYKYSYSDWAGMLTNGWLDAAIPMVYKNSTDYEYQLVNWCNRSYNCWSSVRDIFIGLGGYLNPKASNIVQMKYVYYGQPGATGLKGAVNYHYTSPCTDGGDWWSYVAANIYTNTVSVPDMPWRDPLQATNGMIWGRVQDGKTGQYIDDATVTVAGRPGTVTTDGNGYYVATLIPGTTNGTLHAATFSKAGFASVTTNATVFAADIRRYDIVLRGYTTTTLSPISPNPACAGAALTLTATVAGTNTPTGQVEFFDGTTSLGTAALSGGTATKSVSTLAAGTHTGITATYLGDTANSPSTSSARSVTINAIPSAPAAGNNGPICAGTTLNLTASTVSGATYAWTGPNSFTSSAQNPSIPNATTAASGEYSVRATVGGCTSAAGTTTATVNSIPGAPTAGNNGPIGVGSTLHLTASTISGATYAWAGPNGFTSSDQNPSIPNATTAASGQYSVTATVGGCTSPADSTTAIIVPPPAIAVPPTYDSASGTFRVTFAGISNIIYPVERAPSVTGAWSFLKYATGGPQGVFEVSDTELPPPRERYYRALSP